MATQLASSKAHRSHLLQKGRSRPWATLPALACVLRPTHASGGKVAHGRLLPFCNKWLRWALLEASWVAIGCSPYFGALYQQHRARGKKANTAITIVARRMCRIIWQLLSENRDFEKRPFSHRIGPFPGCSAVRLTARSAHGS